MRPNLLGKLTAIILLAAAGFMLADWRDWIKSPDLLSFERFDRFQIDGEAPWCILFDADWEWASCHYLSENHCVMANGVGAHTGDQSVCVPNPIR
jgi:hypothetical protein